MFVIVLIVINLSLMTCQNNKNRSLQTQDGYQQQQSQENNSFSLTHFIQIPNRPQCPENQRLDKHGICRSVVTFLLLSYLITKDEKNKIYIYIYKYIYINI